MSEVRRVVSLSLRSRLLPARGARPGWMPVWSTAAALRAVRTMLVVPGLFALTYKVIGNLQMATFAAFGGFATLVMAAFGGTRRGDAAAPSGRALGRRRPPTPRPPGSAPGRVAGSPLQAAGSR